MRKWVLVTWAVLLLAPAALGADTAVSVEMDDADAAPGELVIAERIQITAGAASGLWFVVVRNTDGTAAQLTGAGVERVEVVRESDDRVIGMQSSSTELAKLTSATSGVSVPIQSTYRQFATTLAVQVRVKLKTSVALGTTLKLGWGTVDVRTPFGSTAPSLINITGPAPLLTVGPSPSVEFDGAVPDGETYRGERFLAGGIKVDASGVPFDFTVTQVVLKNISTTVPILAGSSVTRIEIRRASDGVLLGDLTSETELAKLTTVGCKVTTSSSNTTPAYGITVLEIWVTLKTSVPAGRTLKLRGVVRCGGTDFTAGDDVPEGDEAPVFTTKQAEGFDAVTNLALDGGQVYSGQRFLAQRIEVEDNDGAPFDVTVTSLVIQNIADGAVRLAENHVVRIEVVRARDGALMGSVSSSSGLNGGGVRVTTASSNVVTDDSKETLEIWVTLGSNVPDGRNIQIKSVIWHTEDNTTFAKTPADPAGPQFITGPAVGEGFEEATTSTLASRNVFQGARFLAQRLKLEDDDEDPYDVVVTSIMVRNVVGDSPLADQNFAGLEVRRASDGAVLGQVVDPVGLSLAGTRVTTSTNNVVPDDTTVVLEIWVFLKTTAPVGRKAELESVVWHAEGVAAFQTAALVGPAIFTTETGTPPTNVEFTWTPTVLKYDVEVTFTPAATIADPEGDVKKATFEWAFGDGGTAQSTGSATAKHTFVAGGTFTVTLTVTGEGGLISVKSHDLVVEGPPNAPPTADFTWAPQAPAQNQPVTFTSTVTDTDQPAGTAFTYGWNFGDGATSALANPQHTFANKQTYTVILTVTDAQSGSTTVQHTVSVGNTPPVVGTLAASPATPSTGDDVTFTASNTTDADAGDTIARYRWDFGDGGTIGNGTATATHVFNAPGTFTVSVIAVDSRGGESVAKTMQITVSGPTRVVVYAYPNPASTQATFNFLLPDGTTDPVLRIFAIDGRLVRVEELATGTTSFLWNLLDGSGDPVGNGLYFCIITGRVGGGTVRSEVFKLLVAR